MQVNGSDGGDWKEGSVVVRKRSKSDWKEEGSVGFGKRCRSSKSSSDLQEDELELEKSPCVFGYPSEDGPVLYCFNLEKKRQSKRNFCRRCCADLFGEDKTAEEEDEPPEQLGVRLLTPPPPSGLPPYWSMAVSVGGTVVYTLGGSYEDPEKEGRLLYSNKVFYFDTDHPQKGWKQGPDMLNKREDGKAVVVDRKIFVFAGVNYKDKDKKKARHPWAECLDTKKNQWEAIPSPPKRFGLTRSELCLTRTPVVCGRKILFDFCNIIYHVDARCWEEFAPKPKPNFSSNLVAVGNKLYWTCKGSFCTFDMKTEKENWGSIEGYPMNKYRGDVRLPEPSLLHLGGSHFCLLTLKDIRLDPTTTTKVRWTKFRVPDEGDFRGSVVCRETFIVPHALSIYNSCAFVMDGKLVRMKKDGVVFD